MTEKLRAAARQALEAAIDAAQPEASTTLNEAESHAHICGKLAEEHKHDVLLAVALTDAAAIIRDLMRDRLGASATGAGQAEIEALRETLATLKAENARLRDALGEIRNRSWTGVMRSNKFELEVALANICLFVDVVLWKEDRND